MKISKIYIHEYEVMISKMGKIKNLEIELF